MHLKDQDPQPGDATGSPSCLTRIVAELSLTFAFVVSAMPRAALAIVMASVPANTIARDYVRQHRHGNDRASWRVITARRPIRSFESQIAAGSKNRTFNGVSTAPMQV